MTQRAWAVITGFVAILMVIGFMSASPIQAPSQRAPAATPLAFEVATVKATKPGGVEQTFSTASCHGIDSRVYGGASQASQAPLGRCILTKVSLKELIFQAYLTAFPSIPINQMIAGAAGWIGSDEWDVEAKAEVPASTTEAGLRAMLQTLLKDRFKLQLHREAKEIQGYSLSVAKNGPKLGKPTESGDPRISMGDGTIIGRNLPISRLVALISGRAGGPVFDRTGLSGSYDFTLSLTLGDPGSVAPADASGPSIFTAVQDQLGLRLEAQKIPIEAVVIDHAEKPPLK